MGSCKLAVVATEVEQKTPKLSEMPRAQPLGGLLHHSERGFVGGCATAANDLEATRVAYYERETPEARSRRSDDSPHQTLFRPESERCSDDERETEREDPKRTRHSACDLDREAGDLDQKFQTNIDPARVQRNLVRRAVGGSGASKRYRGQSTERPYHRNPLPMPTEQRNV